MAGRTSIDSIWQSRYLHAVLAGVAIALAFPMPGVAGLAWVGPGWLLLAGLGLSPKQSFRVGYTGGLAFNLVALSWLMHIPVNKLYPFLGWVSLCAYLAVFPGLWVWACHRLLPRAEAGVGFRAVAQGLLGMGWARTAAWALASGVLWTASEFARGHLLSGFPWNLLGTSQYQMLPVIQLASLTGVYGVSCLVAWTSVGLGITAVALVFSAGSRKWFSSALVLPGLAVASVWFWGAHGLVSQPPPAPGKEPALKLALIQPSVPQTLIWDAKGSETRFQRLLQLSEEALAAKPGLLVWPEAAVPEMLRYDTNTFTAITNLAMRHQVWIILCADDAEPNPRSPTEPFYYNASFLISPEGRIAGRYVKRQLVIFGEYVPLGDWLPFLKHLTPISGGFTRGTGPSPFVMPREAIRLTGNEPGEIPFDALKASVLICFEDVFPEVARSAVDAETLFLVNLTNDGWFGEGAAQWQQAASAVFRAVENRRPVVRCTNTGLTCWIDALGAMRGVDRDDAKSVYGEGFKLVELPLRGNLPETFYHRHGEWFGWGCAALGALLALGGGWRRRATIGLANKQN